MIKIEPYGDVFLYVNKDAKSGIVDIVVINNLQWMVSDDYREYFLATVMINRDYIIG